ncbi:M48 family metallopeptidase [Pseudomonas nicosulfuronedens]|uniref:Peptidase M48 Ste24p n=1 Tax=Pseudomonas nicosulfuronedens TaxID=2571105 RepID=A0A5R9RAE3_9PSED|nr:M48 family metallopeptidase [Pseudomonas nicosulfuronedens]MDH1007476.1 M48 family metallopeptidase [Pseudomonas nicosulfuronedens]MDH1977522.1 M48 family metallopeptidase [Pseudomonas nicosulfuronedens]MDH2028952.1 M48 family metallopeptidase [Pseudomonas nicosulfuronedens]TLX79780.1 peptidase M48 Ste24p [Pseudomonas nicosulfuronedens]
MNFFEHQDRARKQTGRLVLLLSVAVVCLVTITSFALGWLWRHLGEPALHLTSRASLPDPELYLSVAAVIVGVVVLGALYKQVQLSAGGKVVAESLGGRLLNLSAGNADERRLLNVVEEMALASGSPVPPVYVLEDGSINAFAAGLTPRDAVIGITRGAIEQLDRNELQGVIAHEFSHIHHGDMRLNTRLTALLHGMLLLGLIGGMLLRGWSETSTGVRVSSRSSSNNKDGGGSVVLLVIGAGVVLYVLGYVGTFFGQLIKASVSRQREYLADASAVQFTRDPSTIAGALKKIGGNPLGALLSAPRAAEFSHLYFGDGVGSSWFDTHPPLKDRIRRVDPGWDGRYPKFEPRLDVALMNKDAWTAAVTGQPYQPSAVEVAVAAVGAPTVAHLQEARSTLQRLDERLQRAAHDREGAEALIYGLLLDSEPGLRARQLEAIKQRLNLSLALQLDLLEDSLLRLDPGQRLPLLDLAMPALKQLDAKAFVALRESMALLIKLDGKVKLLEWTLLRIIERNLRPGSGKIGNVALAELSEACATLLAFLARVGETSDLQTEQAFADAWSGLPFAPRPLPVAASLRDLETALKQLEQLRPLQKPQLLKALARCIEHDGHITAGEAELMRAVADILDCPMPPLLAS